MAELLRRLVAWAGLPCKPRRAYRHPLREPHSAPRASHLWYPPLPALRSPYRADTLIEGASTVAVRPYVVAHEQRQQCREPGDRTALLLAAGPYWLDGAEVA